jgi:WD40 repeat protein
MFRTVAIRLSLALALSALTLLHTSAQESKPIAANISQDKSAARLKAKLTDYQGPSNYRMRRALMTFSPDGQLLVVSGKGRTVMVWDVKTGALKATLEGGKNGINGFAFSPDGKLAATRDSLDKTVRLWDTGTWQLKTTLTGRKRNLETKLKAAGTHALEEGYAPIVFSPDGRTVLSEREDDLVDVWDIATVQTRATLNHDTRDNGAKDFVKAFLFSPFIQQHYLMLQTEYSPDGRYIATVNGDKKPKLWDASTGNLKTTFQATERIYRADFSPDGRTLALTELQGAVSLWDVESGAWKGKLTKRREEFEFPGFAFSPDGRAAVTFQYEDTKLWDVAEGKLKFVLPKSKATDAAFSPDGRWLAIASESSKSTGRVWSVETGELKTTLPPTKDRAQAIAFSPDGNLIVTTSDMGVRLWDAASGELLATLDEARYPIAFSPDGSMMATGGRKATAMLWEIPARRR